MNKAKNVFRRIYFNTFREACREGIAKKNMIFNDGKKKKKKVKEGLDGMFGEEEDEEGGSLEEEATLEEDETTLGGGSSVEDNIDSALNNNDDGEGLEERARKHSLDAADGDEMDNAVPTLSISDTTKIKMAADRLTRQKQMDKAFERCSSLKNYVKMKSEEIELWDVDQGE